MSLTIRDIRLLTGVSAGVEAYFAHVAIWSGYDFIVDLALV